MYAWIYTYRYLYIQFLERINVVTPQIPKWTVPRWLKHFYTNIAQASLARRHWGRLSRHGLTISPSQKEVLILLLVLCGSNLCPECIYIYIRLLNR